MKNMRKASIIFALIISTSAFAQIENEIAEKPFIEITGRAELEIIPNEIYLNIVIREKYVNKEKIAIEVQEEKLIASLKEIGIDLKNLYLSDANSDYVKIKWRTKDVLTKKDYTLKVTNASIVGQVFQQLDKLEITDANIVKVNHSKIDSLKKEVRIMAIKAAKAKSDYLLIAIGEQTGKPLIIREIENSYSDPSNLNVRTASAYSNTRFLEDDKIKSEEEIQFKKIKIQSAIYIKFSIK